MRPPSGWPEPGSPEAGRLLCQHHTDLKRDLDRYWIVRGWGTASGIGIGAAVAILGLFSLVSLGSNYGACQNVLVQAVNQAGCQHAALFHWAGIALLIAGAVVLGGGLIARRR